ncbi:hypothetical protein A2U01_0061947 [Trifolium medium]|uniref:Uncharacterized protein n=1 Tax=Trifolium medium TaxID=97028 RepID=A0A392RXC0_9FABA|nr:hypothetical protein [Trifolium medium]
MKGPGFVGITIGARVRATVICPFPLEFLIQGQYIVVDGGGGGVSGG